MAKSADAFRTISEVADWLETPTHVLRFWESKFPQVKPVKRAGGRRYYRPADMELLGGIKKLLHDDGMTIKGVQKILREQGIKQVISHSPALDVALVDVVDGVDEQDISHFEIAVEPEAESGEVVQFQRSAPDPAPAPVVEPPAPVVETKAPPEAEAAAPEDPAVPAPEPLEETRDASQIPAFMSRAAQPSAKAESPDDTALPPKPKPRIVQTAPDPVEAMIEASPGVLGTIARRAHGQTLANAAEIAPLLDRLKVLHARMSHHHKD